MAFALGMATVLAALGGFLYERLGAKLLRGIDMELRSRAGVIVSALGERGPVAIDAGRRLIDPDEAFAQVLSSSGRIVDTTPAVRGAPMLPVAVLSSISGPTSLSRRMTGVDDPARLLAVPARRSGRPVVVREWLVDTAATFQARAEAVGSRIKVVASDEQVSLDPVRLRQAVQNLLDNAIRHGGGARPIVVTGERGDGEVRITVEDGGRGFPAPVLERAFEPFSQGPVVAGGGLGAGLGLAIVRAVAEAHGGHASATNSETGGARVVLVVNARDPDAPMVRG